MVTFSWLITVVFMILFAISIVGSLSVSSQNDNPLNYPPYLLGSLTFYMIVPIISWIISILFFKKTNNLDSNLEINNKNTNSLVRISNVFWFSLLASIFGTIISVCYILVFKYSPLEADFSEKASISYLLGINLLICMLTCLVYFILASLFKKENIAAFINGFLLSGVAVSFALLLMFTVDTKLTFKNENADLYKDFYFFIIAPIPFFSVLSWFTFKPLFIKEKTK